MSSKNCQTLSTGWATSKSFLISIRPPRAEVGGRVPLEGVAAADAAEVVGDAVVLERVAGRRRRRTVIPHTGSTASRRCGRRADGAGSGAELAGGAQLDQLGQDRDGDLAVGGVAEVEPDRHAHPVEQVPWHPAVGEVAEHGLAALAGGDQPDERRRRRRPPARPPPRHRGPGWRPRRSSARRRRAAEKSAPSRRSARQPSAAARSASVCAIGERPTTTRCGAGTTGSM